MWSDIQISAEHIRTFARTTTGVGPQGIAISIHVGSKAVKHTQQIGGLYVAIVAREVGLPICFSGVSERP